MYHHISGIMIAFGAFFLAVLSPGPNMLAVIGTSMGSGRRAGLIVALGVSFGSLWWGVLSVVGLTSLITKYAVVTFYIKIGGGVYLLWLAWRSLNSAFSRSPPEPVTIENARTGFAYFRYGLLIQMTNPKAAITWVAILAMAVEPDAPLWVETTIVTGVGLFSVAAYIAYAMLFSSPLVATAYTGFRRWVELSLCIFFCIASYRLITRTLPG